MVVNRIYFIAMLLFLVALASCSRNSTSLILYDTKQLTAKENKVVATIKSLTIYAYTDTVFPSENLSRFVNLKYLKVNHDFNDKCKTCSIPVVKIDTSRLAKLNQLSMLDLGYFNFNGFPKEIYALKNLKNLSIGACLIDSIPRDIGQLENLRVLTLRLNHLRTIPPEIKNLKNLILLDVSNNPFTLFPREVIGMDSLSLNIADQEGSSKDANAEAPQYKLSNVQISYFEDNNINALRAFLKQDNIKEVGISVRYQREKEHVLQNIDVSLRKRLHIWYRPYQ